MQYVILQQNTSYMKWGNHYTKLTKRMFNMTNSYFFPVKQCRRKTFMVRQIFVWWALYILYKFVKSPIKHLGLAIEMSDVSCFSESLVKKTGMGMYETTKFY